MKNRLKKLILVSAMITAPLMASSSEYIYDAYSLVGIEGGYSSLDVERSDTISPASQKKYNLPHVGLKIGAQTNHYRIFLNAHYYSNSDFDYMTTYGGEVQYMFDAFTSANIYMGVGAGVANIRFLPAGEANTRTLSNSYFSGTVGTNIHLSKSSDLEIGGRFMSMSATNTINNITYKFDNLITGYVSYIFKFKMD